MRTTASGMAILALSLVPATSVDDSCHYMKSRSDLSGYETGGPYKLEHFHLTKGRTDLREFIWKHWHNHIKGVAEAKVGTVDAGIVTAVYVVQPDAQRRWGIDVELSRPVQPPPCSAFHVDSLVRVLIRKPDEDNSQTLGPYLPARLADSEVKDARYYNLILMRRKKPLATRFN